MENQTIINGGLALISFMGAWILNNLNESVKGLRQTDTELTKAVQRVEVLIAGSYVKRDELDNLVQALFVKLDKIEAKLDKKVDKP